MSPCSQLARRKVLSILFGLLAAPAMVLANNATEEITPESFATNYMASFGIHRFLLLNKIAGQIIMIDHGTIKGRFNALSGKKSGDDNKPYVTPAGVFPILRSIDQSHPQSAMILSERGNKNYIAIHPVIDIPGQNRRKRIQSSNPDSKRISDGCINLTLDDYKTAADFTLEAMLFSSNGEIIRPAYLLVLPETTKLAEFPWPLNLPTPLKIP